VSAQEQVAAAVAARGYRDPYTAYQFLARNIVKMAEELAEAANWLILDPVEPDFGQSKDTMEAMFGLVGALARTRFDVKEGALWYDASRPTAYACEKIAKELADMQVVLFNAAQAFGQVRGEPFDVVQSALDKATADVTRGVRGAE
jgi:hypothetical protein